MKNQDLQRGRARHRLLLVVSGVLVASLAVAAPLTVFFDDEPAVADQVNANFAAVKTPAGTVIAFAGSTVPSGWLLCDGAPFVAMTHPELAAAIGTTYGGTASAPRVPDLIGRVVVGVDSASARISGAQADLLGEAGGIEANTQVPAHTHPITNEPAHQHSLVAACSGTSCSNANDGFTRGSGGIDANSFRAGAGGAHNHGGATGNTGTPSVTNLQPFLALRYLIKT